MKKILAVILLTLLLAVPAFAEMYTVTLFNGDTITKDTNSSSVGLDLKRYKIDGYFSVQLTVTGDGTVTLEYLLSNDGVTYVEPTSASDITSSHTKTSGPGSDGKDLFSFSPEPARYIKIKVTETGTSSDAVVTVTMFLN